LLHFGLNSYLAGQGNYSPDGIMGEGALKNECSRNDQTTRIQNNCLICASEANDNITKPKQPTVFRVIQLLAWISKIARKIFKHDKIYLYF
jgi:hypothetical protein